MPVFERIAILGVGLIGASIARAAKTESATGSIAIYDANAEVRARAKELGLGEVFESAAEATASADLIVLAAPVGAMSVAMQEAAAGVKPGAIITDVGSVKRAVVEAIKAHAPAHAFIVPGHPSRVRSIRGRTLALRHCSKGAGTS